MQSTDAIIVGAGAAGLMAARELRRAGKTVIVLESNKRVGGRVITLHNTNAGLPIELGAEFIHGDAPETTRLTDEARLVTVRVTGTHYRSDRGEFAPQDPAWKRMEQVFRYLNPDRKKDRSFQEFLDEKHGGRKLADERELARGFVQGFNGADTRLISEKSIAQQGHPTEGATDARRIVSGYGSLIEYLERDVAGDIRLNTRVTRIAWDESRVRVWDHNGAEYNARCVILTVPLPMLQDSSIAIEPEIPMARRAARTLVMGQVLRAVVVVRERFWEKKNDALAYLHAPKRAINVWWTQYPLRAPVLVAWSGGPPAVEIAQSGDVEGQVISELARVFGRRRSRIEALVDSIHRHDWTHDPNIRGAYSYSGIGGAYSPRTLARPFGRVFIAGEATEGGTAGTVEAAIVSGKRAARQALKRLS
jgi:monoamine oxidase